MSIVKRRREKEETERKGGNSECFGGLYASLRASCRVNSHIISLPHHFFAIKAIHSIVSLIHCREIDRRLGEPRSETSSSIEEIIHATSS
jgi:hypothetical protein